MSIGRDAAVAYSDALKPYNIARTTSTYDVDRLGEFMLSYKKEFGRHHFDALAGYTLQKKTYDRLGVEATGFAYDRIHEVTAHGSEATDVQLYDTRKAGWAMMSFLTRVNYAFDDRYTLTASFRADGSSRFGVDSRWGYFPSVSAGWTLSNEPFLKDALERVASIRLRASWGKSGNNDIGNYASIASISTGSYAFGNTPVSTTYEGSFADAALGWETTTQTNIGIDLGFLGGRLNVIGNYYNSISSDILYDYPISSISGATATKTNLGTAKIRNRGFDFQVDARVLTGKVNWNVSANVSVNRNKVVSMGGLDDIISTTERSVGSHITKEGYPIGSFYGYNAIGIMSKADYANALLDREVYLKNGNKFPEGYELKGPAVSSYSLDALSYGNAIWEDVNGDGLITTDARRDELRLGRGELPPHRLLRRGDGQGLRQAVFHDGDAHAAGRHGAFGGREGHHRARADVQHAGDALGAGRRHECHAGRRRFGDVPHPLGGRLSGDGSGVRRRSRRHVQRAQDLDRPFGLDGPHRLHLHARSAVAENL